MAKFIYHSTKRMVEFFLKQGKEGDCWDFKQEWHKNMHELIKDIICFANTSHDETCYIIFGVTNDLKVVGMKQPRTKQADIIDAISNLMFAGDIYPKIDVETIIYDGVELDVLKIFNTENTPLYLKRNYGNMLEGCIYLRVGDKNTPDKGNAHIEDIEILWKKRLGLLKPPLEQIYDRLQNKKEWAVSNDTFYNIYKPEYTLNISNDDMGKGDEFYAYSVTNETIYYEILSIKSHNTLLDEFQLVVLDGGRLEITTPDWGYFYYDESKIHPKYSYKFYILGSYKFRILNFLYDEENDEERYAFNKFKKVILFYESIDEKLAFEIYVNENLHILDEKLKTISDYDYINTGNEKKNKIYKENLRVGLALNLILKEWRKSKNNNL